MKKLILGLGLLLVLMVTSCMSSARAAYNLDRFVENSRNTDAPLDIQKEYHETALLLPFVGESYAEEEKREKAVALSDSRALAAICKYLGQQLVNKVRSDGTVTISNDGEVEQAYFTSLLLSSEGEHSVSRLKAKEHYWEKIFNPAKEKTFFRATTVYLVEKKVLEEIIAANHQKSMEKLQAKNEAFTNGRQWLSNQQSEDQLYFVQTSGNLTDDQNEILLSELKTAVLNRHQFKGSGFQDQLCSFLNAQAISGSKEFPEAELKFSFVFLLKSTYQEKIKQIAYQSLLKILKRRDMLQDMIGADRQFSKDSISNIRKEMEVEEAIFRSCQADYDSDNFFLDLKMEEVTNQMLFEEVLGQLNSLYLPATKPDGDDIAVLTRQNSSILEKLTKLLKELELAHDKIQEYENNIKKLEAIEAETKIISSRLDNLPVGSDSTVDEDGLAVNISRRLTEFGELEISWKCKKSSVISCYLIVHSGADILFEGKMAKAGDGNYVVLIADHVDEILKINPRLQILIAENKLN